jgi:diguanylate cyclase (GGDEF)-like protein
MSEFAVSIGILWALFFSCVTIGAALAIAWAQFGHPRYALSWSLAFGMNALQTALNVVAVLAGPNEAMMNAAFAALMIPSPLFAIGARQRAGLPDRRYHYFGVAALVLAYLLVAKQIPWLAPYADPAATTFSALVLLDAAMILRPRAPKHEVAEWALTASIATLSLMELIVAVFTAAYDLTGRDQLVGAFYHGTLIVAVPPCVIASGVSAILVVASDLALQLRRIAARDPLTGLYNRRGFRDLAVQTIARAHANRQPISLVLCDIDHFKRINDDHGHAVGDQTLIHVGRRLLAGMRADDLVGRIGGEEFAMLVLDHRGYEAAQTMDRIRADVGGGLEVGARRVAVTVSFGISEVGLDGTIDAMLSDAFDRADRALYRSKFGGRDRVTLAGNDNPEPRFAFEGITDF